MNYARPHFKPNTEQPGGDLFVAKVTAAGSPNPDDGTIPHAWTEQRFDPASRSYVDMESGGRSGTTTNQPAYDLNKKTVAAGTYVHMRLRGWVDLSALSGGQSSGPVYDIVRRCCVTPAGGDLFRCCGLTGLPDILFAEVVAFAACPSLVGLVVPMPSDVAPGVPGTGWFSGCVPYSADCAVQMQMVCAEPNPFFAFTMYIKAGLTIIPVGPCDVGSVIQALSPGNFALNCSVARPVNERFTFTLTPGPPNPFAASCCFGGAVIIRFFE